MKVQILGGGNAGVGRAIAELLKQLEHEVVVARAKDFIYELKAPIENSLLEVNKTNFTPDREYGWYRKFEKNSKKRNFKKAI